MSTLVNIDELPATLEFEDSVEDVVEATNRWLKDGRVMTMWIPGHGAVLLHWGRIGRVVVRQADQVDPEADEASALRIPAGRLSEVDDPQ